jgi:hypothetical protein
MTTAMHQLIVGLFVGIAPFFTLAGQARAQASGSTDANASIEITGFIWGGLTQTELPAFMRATDPIRVGPDDGGGSWEGNAGIRGTRVGDVLNPGGPLGDAGTLIYCSSSANAASRATGWALSLADAVASLTYENTSDRAEDAVTILFSVNWAVEAFALGTDAALDTSNALGSAFIDVTGLPRIGGEAGRVVFPPGDGVQRGDSLTGEIVLFAGQAATFRVTTDTTAYARSIPVPGVAAVFVWMGMLGGLRRRRKT